ncbi:MAG: DUF3237 domain-containing protein [Burkholderiales bacterium]|jgi:hypothetical protein
MTPPSLEFAFECALQLKPRVKLDPLPQGGSRLFVPVAGGRFEGPKLRGVALEGGGEWPHVREDGVFCFDARYFLREDDGTVIQLQNRGYRHGPPEVMERLWRLAPGDVVRDDEYYFRCTPTFETCAGPHDWLCSSVFVGVGSRGPAGNVIRYWRVA